MVATSGSTVENLRDTARMLFAIAVAAADPAQALRKRLADAALPQPDPGGKTVLLALGKAAGALMETALAHIGPAPDVTAISVTNYENFRTIPGCRGFAAGHPVPDENGLAAANAVIEALTNATARDRVIVLISGGGSALLPAPAEGLTLKDKAEVNRQLLATGADITAMNLVRQQLSRLKGGGMCKLAAPAPITGFILSDVIGDDLRVVASGPTTEALGTAADAVLVLQRFGIWPSLPASVRDHLAAAKPGPPDHIPAAVNHLIGSNGMSLAAVRDVASGWQAKIVTDRLTGDVADACAAILAAVAKAPKDRPACLIFGGETTVSLRGNGKGGRNQELAMRVAMAMPPGPAPWTFLSGGTDGRDGPTEAAGGLVDGGTLARMHDAGIDPAALLSNNDSNAALAASGDLLIVGATGTNVADVQIFLRQPS